jgi:hypothetical protein
MQIGGTLVNAVVRIAVVAATLALAYFFILKPILSTTETVSSGINGNIQNAFDDVNQAFESANNPGGVNQRGIKRKINSASGVNQERLITCIQNAQQDITRIQRCANRFGP